MVLNNSRSYIVLYIKYYHNILGQEYYLYRIFYSTIFPFLLPCFLLPKLRYHECCILMTRFKNSTVQILYRHIKVYYYDYILYSTSSTLVQNFYRMYSSFLKNLCNFCYYLCYHNNVYFLYANQMKHHFHDFFVYPDFL